MTDLKLNRFSKRPERFLLEEYSSCEVPAGCGGIVLRWMRPGEPVFVALTHFSPAPAKLFLDGEPLSTQSFRLAVGAHVLAVELESVPPKGGLFIASMTIRHRRLVAAPLVTAADGTWRFQTTPPGEGWRRPDFDDAGWPALERDDFPKTEKPFGSYLLDSLAKSGAVGLAPPAAARKGRWFANPGCWIRRGFRVDDRGIS
jgi:hypothetical protein